MISEDDYKQVFEETCMSIIEGLAAHADRAGINDFEEIINKWANYFIRKEHKSHD